MGHPFYHCVQSSISEPRNGESMNELSVSVDHMFSNCVQSMINEFNKGEGMSELSLSVDYLSYCCMVCDQAVEHKGHTIFLLEKRDEES